MNAQHTQGPFSTSGIPGDNHIMARCENRRVTVAIVPGWKGITNKEHAANMALFASAPELLCLLRRFYDATYGQENTGQLAPLDFEQARAAIARATGGAK